MYFGGGLAFTAATAVAASRSPAVMNMVMKNSMLVGWHSYGYSTGFTPLMELIF